MKLTQKKMLSWTRSWLRLHKCKQEQHDKCENSSLCHLCDGKSLYKNTREDKLNKLEVREKRKKEEKNAAFRKYKKEKKEGMAFEKLVQSKWNSAFQKKENSSLSAFKSSRNQTKIQKPRLGVLLEKTEQTPLVETSSPQVSLSTLHATFDKNSKKPDAKRQVNSGAMWHAKGDIITQDYLMECKERGTINARGEKTISIPKEWLEKQALEAFQEKRPYWLLPFRYKNDSSIYLVKSFDHEIEMYQEMISLREELEKLKKQICSN